MVTKIIFFDGVCGLCNRFVDFVIPRDKKRRFRYAPLQGETAKNKIGHLTELQTLKSVVYYEDGKTYTRSSAVLQIVAQLGGPWWLAKIFFLVPRFLRDHIYEFIAEHRYQWFGKRETCRFPTPEERELFLD